MIEVRGLTRDFRTADRAVAALGGIDLAVETGSFLVLLGPSGSGKTTLLRCIAGLETPDDGEISIADRIVFSAERKIAVSPETRKLGMVFQSYAVWPHLTVAQNVSLPLAHGANRIPRGLIGERVQKTLAAVQLESMGDRPTTMLSGGQQQRVALARALAIEPRALLMDEPLSNLDARLREEIRAEIKAAVKQIGVTVLYVTHDQAEAMALADRIAVMDAGHVVQTGTPSELYLSPATPRVAEFFGSMNWISGIVRDARCVETSLGSFAAPTSGLQGPVMVGIRPEDVRLRLTATGTSGEVTGRTLDQTFFGDYQLCRVRAADENLVVKIGIDVRTDLCDHDIWLEFPPEKLHIFPARAG